MTSDAHGRVFRSHPRRVEVGPVWIEPETAAHRGMTRRAVALGMARCAGFETLSRGLPVPKTKTPKGVVVTFLADSRRCDKSRLLVTALAELRRVVAVAAIGFARVGRARVARDEILGVVAGLPGAVGAVTLETHRSLVACLACPGTRACL